MATRPARRIWYSLQLAWSIVPGRSRLYALLLTGPKTRWRVPLDNSLQCAWASSNRRLLTWLTISSRQALGGGDAGVGAGWQSHFVVAWLQRVILETDVTLQDIGMLRAGVIVGRKNGAGRHANQRSGHARFANRLSITWGGARRRKPSYGGCLNVFGISARPTACLRARLGSGLQVRSF
jgi:hypothetical protein